MIRLFSTVIHRNPVNCKSKWIPAITFIKSNDKYYVMSVFENARQFWEDLVIF